MLEKIRYVNSRDIWLMLLLIPIALPTGIIGFLGISHIVTYLKILSLGIFLIVYTVERIRLDKYIVFVFLYVISLVISTVFNKGSFEKCTIAILNIFCPVLWCRLSLEKHRIISILNKLVCFLFFISIIDIIAYWIYPNGISVSHTGELLVRSGIISNDNSIAPYLVPACILALFTMSKNKKDSAINTVLTFAIFLYAVFFVKTGVGMFISLFCVFFYILYRFSSKSKIVFSPERVCFVLIVVFLVVCVFGVTGWFTKIAIMFESTGELSGRTKLWLYVIPMILKKPILGYGVLEDNYLIGYLYRTTAHNMYFQIMIWSGILGLIPIIMIFLHSIKNAKKYWDSKDMRTLFVGVTGVLIYFIFEVHQFVPIFWISLSLINYYDLLMLSDKDFK